MPSSLLVNVVATFAPLLLSSGSVLFMAHVYSQRISRWSSAWTIVIWCVCELCMGISLLLLMHAIDSDAEEHTTSAYVGKATLALILVLWCVISTSLCVYKAFLVCTVAAFLNFIAHYIIVGVTLTSAGATACILAILSSVWVCWTLFFSLSFSLYVKKRAMKKLGGAIMNNVLHVDAIQHAKKIRRRTNSPSSAANV